MSDATLPVLAALKSRLKADAGVSALVSDRIYTDVPQGAAFPYIAFGPIVAEPWDSSCTNGSEIFPQIDVWSRKPGPAECLSVRGAVYAALHDQTLAVANNDHVLMRVDNARYMRDRDGETHHGIIRLRILTSSSGD